VACYARQEEKLTDDERERRLRVADELLARPQSRPQSDVEQELRELKRARRVGWRRADG
jgi:hypothetical protein